MGKLEKAVNQRAMKEFEASRRFSVDLSARMFDSGSDVHSVATRGKSGQYSSRVVSSPSPLEIRRVLEGQQLPYQQGVYYAAQSSPEPQSQRDGTQRRGETRGYNNKSSQGRRGR